MTQTENAGHGKYADELRDHKFDGIQEFDNHLPNWWLWTFYGACIFALFYWLYYHGLGWGDSSYESYRKEMEAAAAAKVVVDVTEDSLAALSQDADAVKAGRQVYEINCVACHGPSAGGVVSLGPNLTDNFWLHGGAGLDIHRTITNGVPGTAMVSWNLQLGPTRIQQVAAYVLSIRNTNVAGGKPPEGQPYEPK